MDDRISQLPIPILHKILCFLPQKEAVRTCLLSKQWHHIASTRPNLEFSEKWFKINHTQEKFVPVVDRTLQRCREPNRSKLHRIISLLLCRQWRRNNGSIRPNLDSSQNLLNTTQQNCVSVNSSIGSTSPNLDSSEQLFNTTQQSFVSVTERTLQGYHDQNISIQKFHLDLFWPLSPPVISLLDKWIPIIAALNIKAFKLNFHSYTPPYYDLPSAVLLAESLEELHLSKCRLSPVESVKFKSLRTLTLEQVQVDDVTLENILSGCPLLGRLVLDSCEGLRNIRIEGLEHFELTDHEWIRGRSIEIDAPNLETVSITGLWIWSHRQSTFLFSRLTSLDLYYVKLSSESFDLLSFGCPTLESLNLHECFGFKEIYLANDSVKNLCIWTGRILLKGVTICAPKIVDFEFTAPISKVPDTFSVAATTSKEWHSYVVLSSREDDHDFDANSWFLRLRRMLKALSGSRISLILEMPCSVVDCSHILSDHPPVVVEKLTFNTCISRTASWYKDFTNGLFRVCRPRHIWGCTNRLSEFQFNILLANESLGTEPYFWGHELEQVHMKTGNGKIWQLVEWTDLSELRNRTYTYDDIMCLELKWRGQKAA
ncbi:F-box/RNI-like superfamily protein [Striga asiatica]|uniref:F-box/RNI-like superfamily protein n=1 Tax=Striga asiatica TaxID=4170 RepID=A0A5A7QGW0_STRAF|nr:F-box/RNI-like superfamily protein [Striga asiatica]